jgi:hypothetical protein
VVNEVWYKMGRRTGHLGIKLGGRHREAAREQTYTGPDMMGGLDESVVIVEFDKVSGQDDLNWGG